ncbi:MAG: response regulator [Gemmatimonadaceae bacterium]
MNAPVVLLVDDNEDCRIIYGAALRHAGYTVRTANDGFQCLDSAADARPDLILLDIGMPRMDGMETLERLKGDPVTSGIPVVAVSARVGRDQHDAALSAGFSEVLLKPITPGEILASVQRHFPLSRMPS